MFEHASGSAAASAALPALDSTIGAIFVGAFIAAALWGVSCVQYYNYVGDYKDDAWYIKAMVAAAWASDTVHQILISHTVYTYVVTNFSNPVILGELVWSLIAEVLFNGITALIVQSFFTFRIYRLSGQNAVLAGFVWLLVLAEFVAVLVYVAKAMPMRTFAQLSTLKSLSMTVNALAAVGDVVIAACLCFLLQKSRTGFRQSETMIRRLMMFTINTGLLTSLCAIASLVMIASLPATFIYICFYFTLGRLYINSLLATLNVRTQLRETSAGSQELSTFTLQNVSRRFGGSAPSDCKPSTDHLRDENLGPVRQAGIHFQLGAGKEDPHDAEDDRSSKSGVDVELRPHVTALGG